MASTTGDYEMSPQNSVVAVYSRHTEADQAVKELQRGGVDMHKLSIVGKGYHTDEHAVGYYNTGDRMKYWGKVGAFWGGFWGLLFGSAFFLIPGLGPILAAGPVVAWIVAGLEGAVEVGALGALGAGLYSIGIPKDSIVKYEAALKSDQFLLIRLPSPVTKTKQLSRQPFSSRNSFGRGRHSHVGEWAGEISRDDFATRWLAPLREEKRRASGIARGPTPGNLVRPPGVTCTDRERSIESEL
jgi:uncharacterized membrane protein